MSGVFVPDQGVSAKSFIDNGNGAITDNDTGLIWQQGEGGVMDWDSALTYCENLTLAEYSDWRFPNVKELRSIADLTKYNPAIDTTYFPGTNSSLYYYWSSTTEAGYTPFAWAVGFLRGSVVSSLKSNGHYVRCVRGGM